jgi:hypothetical protein
LVRTKYGVLILLHIAKITIQAGKEQRSIRSWSNDCRRTAVVCGTLAG